MPTQTQYNIVKNQVKSFETMGFISSFEMQSIENEAAPKVFLMNKSDLKIYKFCDPDWNIVSMQLSTLYKKHSKQ